MALVNANVSALNVGDTKQNINDSDTGLVAI